MMDRTLVMVAGGAAGCGLLLGLAVMKNERSFNERFHAQRPPEVAETVSHRDLRPVPRSGDCPPAELRAGNAAQPSTACPRK